MPPSSSSTGPLRSFTSSFHLASSSSSSSSSTWFIDCNDPENYYLCAQAQSTASLSVTAVVLFIAALFFLFLLVKRYQLRRQWINHLHYLAYAQPQQHPSHPLGGGDVEDDGEEAVEMWGALAFPPAAQSADAPAQRRAVEPPSLKPFTGSSFKLGDVAEASQRRAEMKGTDIDEDEEDGEVEEEGEEFDGGVDARELRVEVRRGDGEEKREVEYHDVAVDDEPYPYTAAGPPTLTRPTAADRWSTDGR